MSLLPKIFKNNNVVIDCNSLVLENKTNEDLALNIQTISYTNNDYKSNNYEKSKILWQARLQANKILEKANVNAKKLMQKTQHDAQNEFEVAKKNGFEQGYNEGIQEANNDLQSRINDLTEIINAMEEKKSTLLKEYENELTDLALSIASKVIDSELERDDEKFLTLYRNALTKHSEQKWVKISVSQYEAEFATRNSDLLLSMAKGAKDIKINILENAPRGTCIVETPISITDASAQTQLSKLEDSFVDVELSV